MDTEIEKAPHPTLPTAIKIANVDVVMIPLIRWMNGFNDISTHFCCQGELAEEEEEDFWEELDSCDKPYVLWTSTNILDTILVLNAFKGFGDTSIEFYNPAGCIRYTTRFRDQQSLLQLCEMLGLSAVK